jgi:arabinose-5-phosphate isomerase
MHTAGLPMVALKSSLGQALEVLNQGRLGIVVVVDAGGQLQGLLTDGDVRRLVCAQALDLDASVEASMIKDPSVVRPDQSAAQALDLLEQKSITVLPVLDDVQRLVGLIHLHDLLGKGRLRFS